LDRLLDEAMAAVKLTLAVLRDPWSTELLFDQVAIPAMASAIAKSLADEELDNPLLEVWLKEIAALYPLSDASMLLEELLRFRELAWNEDRVAPPEPEPEPEPEPPPRELMLALMALSAASMLDEDFEKLSEDVWLVVMDEFRVAR
jgi:hypothetical protein